MSELSGLSKVSELSNVAVWPKVSELSSAARHWPYGPGNGSKLRDWASLSPPNSDSGPNVNALPHARTNTPTNNIHKA